MYIPELSGGGGALNFFQVGVSGPDFRSVGLANWHLPLKRGACERKISKFRGLWAENFQIWGLWTKIWAKIEAVEAKISKFSQKGVLWTDSFAWNGTLASGRRGVKGGLQGRTSPYPLSRSVPPPGELSYLYGVGLVLQHCSGSVSVKRSA